MKKFMDIFVSSLRTAARRISILGLSALEASSSWVLQFTTKVEWDVRLLVKKSSQTKGQLVHVMCLTIWRHFTIAIIGSLTSSYVLSDLFLDVDQVQDFPILLLCLFSSGGQSD
jgi:hypothetical protein